MTFECLKMLDGFDKASRVTGINILKTFNIDTLYNSKILYNIICICTNVPVYIEFEFFTTEIQFYVKLFGDKYCQCKEG